MQLSPQGRDAPPNREAQGGQQVRTLPTTPPPTSCCSLSTALVTPSWPGWRYRLVMVSFKFSLSSVFSCTVPDPPSWDRWRQVQMGKRCGKASKQG